MNDKMLRNVGRALALVWALWWTVFGVVAGIGERLEPLGVFFHTAVPGILFLLVALAAMRWELPGGILLVLAAVLTLIAFPYAQTAEGFLVLAMPPLLAGMMFVTDWSISAMPRAGSGSGRRA